MIYENLQEIRDFIDLAIEDEATFNSVQTLRIDRRKPHTDRLFFYLPSKPDLRVCLHRFSSCSEDESFAHPHSWESEVKILSGRYKHYILDRVSLDEDASEIFDVFKITPTILGPGSSYSIKSPHTWHKVIPLTECRTIMVNGPIWDVRSKYCKFTKGKELVEIPKEDKLKALKEFKTLLRWRS